jgi:N-acetylmuramoyl-L-alanine amidase
MCYAQKAVEVVVPLEEKVGIVLSGIDTTTETFSVQVSSKEIAWPVQSVINITNMAFGVQLETNANDNVFSMSSGEVVSSETFERFSNVIIIKSKSGFTFVYAGLDNVTVKNGEYVESGDNIGTVGFDNIENKYSLLYMIGLNDRILNPLEICACHNNISKSLSALDAINTIVIDPGHGGNAIGGSGFYYINGNKITLKEKDLNLHISKKLQEMLISKFPKKNIILTRSDDDYYVLQDRINIISNNYANGSNIAISFHINAASSKTASGFEIWYLRDEDKLSPSNSYFSKILADDVYNGMLSQIGEIMPSRGIKTDEWYILRNTVAPSILIEAGMITNQKDASLLDSNDYQTKLCEGIVDGISMFVNSVEVNKE